jgi:hypothetical protein
MPDEQQKTELIDSEYVLDIYRACELLSKDGKKITPKTHVIRVTHEVTRDAAPWALVRLQAIRRK